MRRSRMVAVTGVVALATATLGATAATAAPQASPSRAATTSTTASTAAASDGQYAVLADSAAEVDSVVAGLKRAGATVVSVNRAIGLVTVTSDAAGFARTAGALKGVDLAARDGVVGHSPDATPTKDAVLREHQAAAGRTAAATKGKKKNPATARRPRTPSTTACGAWT